MAKLLVLFVAMMLFTACGTQNITENAGTEENGKSDFAITEEIVDEVSIPENTGVKITDLGIPLGGRYNTNTYSIVPNDIAISEGRLFVGSGDCNSNTGPVDMWAYDIAEKAWVLSGTLPDEEINRFLFINGVLTAPGTDPKADWSAGNYYAFENGEWTTHRVLPPSCHCFDMAEIDGKIIAIIDSTSGYYRAAVSENGGKTFRPVPFIKDGIEIENPQGVHYYDLYEIGGELYTDISYYGQFRFEDDRFVYSGDPFFFTLAGNSGFAEVKYCGEAVHNGVLYIANGNVYEIDGPDSVRRMKPQFKGNFYDIYEYGGKLYFLCITKEEGYYINAVYTNESGTEEGFELVTRFYYESPAACLAVDGNKFYFAICSKKKSDENRGRIIEIEKLD